ncbi:MAG: uncharacterized membrane protein YgdD (TMEM256/DUF423 family) [Arenicella sp.]|jgi:uncharacterized membrane protein YgdD (TMEM256/DUF423 family)
MIDKQVKTIAFFGAFICLLAVAVGAFGAHAFKHILIANQKEAIYDLANRYQFYHGLALMLIAAIFNRSAADINSTVKPNLKLIGVLMLLGTIIFSGSLYFLALLNMTWLGAVTPIGGLLLLIAWFLLLLQIVKAGQ